MTQTLIAPNIEDIEFLQSGFDRLTTEKKFELPSKYIERVRYMPPELTRKPGYYSYDYTPYLREIVDHLSPLSPIQEIVILKPSQIGFTTGVLEAGLAYKIGCDPGPQMFMTADKELAEKQFETKVERMIDSCNLRPLIRSQTNVGKTRKTGDTSLKKEYPGGFLHAIGGRSGSQMRSMSYNSIMVDEFDAFPMKIGEEGTPRGIFESRVMGFGDDYKIVYGSTPLLMQTSRIWPLFLEGDQRYFMIPCKHCGEFIVLMWHMKENETSTGDKAGILFDVTESGRLIADSVIYKTQCCGKHLHNHDKSIFLGDGFWEPTAEPEHDKIVSYSINSLYSPPGMYNWEKMARDWLKVWDIKKNRVKDIEEYKTFRNTKQGLPWEEQGSSPRYEKVVQYRRQYAKNQILNKQIQKDNGSPLLLLICSVDCHPNSLHVDIKGYCQDKSSYTIDYRVFEGNCESLENEPWKLLEKIIENEIWTADDGKQYRIRTTFIDEGWNTKAVREFCGRYTSGVYSIKGAQFVRGNLTYKQMSKEVIEKAGVMCYEVNTTILKDQVAYNFKRDWNSGELQPPGYPNFPNDLRDDYFRYFEAEMKAEEIDKKTKKFIKFVWKKISENKENHGFDTFVYNLAALELVATTICIKPLDEGGLGLDNLEWGPFWEYAKKGVYYEIGNP
jgi:phage terminase large subunit GpA-like protein